LRLNVARNAIAAAKMSRSDVERTVTFQVKAAYVQVAQAVLDLRFAKDITDSSAKMLALVEARYQAGAINQGDVARARTQKLESDQALDAAMVALRQARVALTFLLGVRGRVPDFEVDTKILDFSVPAVLDQATEQHWLRLAFDRRADLQAAGYTRASAAAQVDLTARQRFPDITLSLSYVQGGYGGAGTSAAVPSPPLVTFGITMPLPALYQLQGELRQARAQEDAEALQQAKTTAQVASDVATAYAAIVASRRLVERMERGGLLESARVARDVTRIQFDGGAASLTDYLRALQAYIATTTEYVGDLAAYRTAFFQLEEAAGGDLR
jgi:outer membrane protein TolC